MPSNDLLRWPVVGSILRWKHSRVLFQFPVLILSFLMVLHGFLGPSLSPKNLATTLVWVHFRGLLVLLLLCAGNLFCFACPFVLMRDWARRLIKPRFPWPRALRNKWLSILLFAGILFTYEAFSLWASPYWTACLILGYFVAILAVDSTFKHASFCKYVCPVGQFNFIAATLSPLEVQIRSASTCTSCHTNDCIRGTRSPTDNSTVLQRGCELALFQPRKVGNLDCTFCLDCVHACPHDNVGIVSRVPGGELLDDGQLRSGIGRLSRRPDIAALATLFTFGALMNAFGMVTPVYTLERWISRTIGWANQAAVLAIVFVTVLILAPFVLLGGASALTKRWAALSEGVLGVAIRYSYSLVPLGFGLWLAHYGFHLLTGLYTAVPVAQNAAAAFFGTPVFGIPNWRLVGLPISLVQPLEFGFMALGAFGSLSLAHGRATADCPSRSSQAFAPWALVILVLFASAVWLLSQPMDMRATFLE